MECLIEVIPKRKGANAAESFTAWDRETRLALSAAASADSKFYDAIRQPRGKFHGPDALRALRESYQLEGPRDPVLVAVVDGREIVIDGRHRLELDPKWPKKVLSHITTREQAINAILEADDFARVSLLPTKARAKLAELIGELGKAPKQGEIKRSAVERELLADASRSNRAIAELVGVGNQLVGPVRDNLCESHKIHAYVFSTAKTGKHSAECWCGEGDYTGKPERPKKRLAETPTVVAAATAEAQRRRAGEKPVGAEVIAAQLTEQGTKVGRKTVEQAIKVADARLEPERPVDAAACTCCPVHCPK